MPAALGEPLMDGRYRHNAAFRRIAHALLLTRHDIRDITALGGEQISASQADGWKRNPETRRKPDEGSDNPQNLERRGKPITDSQWRAFWCGLDEWLHKNSGEKNNA